MENNVIGIVKFNSGVAYVFEKNIELVYYRFGDTIIGTDGVFYSCLYRKHERGAKAFGGREFELTMNDGEVVKCNGQWWSGVSSDAVILIGSELVNCTASCKDDLLKCYVYRGYIASKDELKKISESYNDVVYEYYDFEKIIKHNRPNKIVKKITGKQDVIADDGYLYRYYFINNKLYFNKLYMVDGFGNFKMSPK